ncbi:unnamed protein product, partial [Didymodactylos carnosus]
LHGQALVEHVDLQLQLEIPRFAYSLHACMKVNCGKLLGLIKRKSEKLHAVRFNKSSLLYLVEIAPAVVHSLYILIPSVVPFVVD